MASQEIYEITADGGAGPLKFSAVGLPDECSCDEITGVITCDENVKKGSYKFTAFAEDQMGTKTEGAEISFEVVGESYSSFTEIIAEKLFVTFDGVSLCPGSCTAPYDYITYEAVSSSFVNGRSFELTKSASSSASDPGVGTVWTYSDPSSYITKKTDICGNDPYGAPLFEDISLDITVKLRDTEIAYLFEILINEDSDGGTIFDARYNLSDPWSQIPGQTFSNSNTTCDENKALHGSMVIGIGGTATFAPTAPCTNFEDE